jgi:predicted component of type VI protein secretion system
MTKKQMKLQQLLAGVEKDLPATSSLNVNGEALKQSDIVTKLQGWIQLYEQKDGAKVAAGSAVGALKQIGQEVTQFTVSFGRALKQFLGESSPLLADFGLGIAERKAPSSKTRVLAQAKGAATRVARKTMGAVQKKAVKGAPVASVTVAPNAETSVVSVDSQASAAAGAPDAVNPTASPLASNGGPSPVPIGGGGK